MRRPFAKEAFRDWRLPSISELRSLGAPKAVRRSLTRAGFEGLWLGRVWLRWWTNETLTRGSPCAMDYSLFGKQSMSEQVHTNSVLCVRGAAQAGSISAPVKISIIKVRAQLQRAFTSLAKHLAKSTDWPTGKRALEVVMENVWFHDVQSTIEESFAAESADVAASLLKDPAIRRHFERAVIAARKKRVR